MKSGRSRCGIFGIGLAAAILASAAMGASYTNIAAGRFDTGAIWNPAGPPGSADTVVFNQGSGTRRTITFPVGTTTTAGLQMYKENADNKYEFAIADSGAAATYNAGAAVLGSAWAHRADLLLSTGTLVSTSVSMSGYDALVKIVLDGSGTTWRVNNNWYGTQITLDLDIQNGARLEAQGGGATDHTLYTETLDGNPTRQQRIRVTGAGSALIMTNRATQLRSVGHVRFEVLDGARATFSDFTLYPVALPSVMVVSNATLETGNFFAEGNSVSQTTDVSFVNSTVTCAKQFHLAAYYGYSLATIDNTAVTLYGDLLSIGGQDSLNRDGSSLTIQNGSKVIGTNAVLRLGRAAPSASLLVTGTNTLLSLRFVNIGGSASGPAVGSRGTLLVISNGATVAHSSTVNGEGAALYTNGILRLSSGTFSNASALVLEAGVLEGAGTIVGPVIIDSWIPCGTVRSGGIGAVGKLDIGSTYNQKSGSAGRLELEIGGTSPGTGYDVLSVTSTVTIAGGAVAITQLPGFTPPIGVTTYDLVTGSTLTTNGATVSLPPDGGGVKWSVAVATLTGGRKALRVTSDARAKGTVVQVR